VVAALATGPASAQNPRPPGAGAAKLKGPPPAENLFRSPEAILRWINHYRTKPEPQRVPEAVRALSELGVFKDQEGAGVYIGFIAGVISDNQTDAPALIAQMFPLPQDDQVTLIKAIAYSGLPNWKELLSEFAERMPARKVMIDRFLNGKMKPLAELPLDASPAVLDMWWGFYFATASYQPALRIVDALAWSKEDNNVERLTIAGMAKWTLGTNAARDVDLLRLLRAELPHQPKTVVPALREVIEAADTLELAKLRRDAVAAIEDLKRKGPAKDRDLAGWAQAGTTLIALGCVIAGATGHVEFGLPCIIGGPTVQAATKLLLPQLQSKAVPP
jgi:hypothetical protein